MKAKEIREMSTEEIATRIQEEQAAYSQMHFQHAIADLQNPMQIREKRRLIAQLHTILRERTAAS